MKNYNSYSHTLREIIFIIMEETYNKRFVLRGDHYFLQKHNLYRRMMLSFLACQMIKKHHKRYLRILRGDILYVPHIEIVVTTKCSLRCKHCANLIQYYKHPYHISKEQVINSVDRFMEIVDYVGRIRILGGEPLLHPELEEILNVVNKKRNVGTVEVITNGTILPKREELKKSLQNKKTVLEISDYGENSYHKEEMLKYCKENGIHVAMALPDSYWKDFGDIQFRNRTKKELKQQRRKCKTRCFSLLKGKIHICPRSSNGEDLGLFTCKPNEYMDLFSKTTLEEKRGELYKFFSSGPKVLTACNYCDEGTGKLPRVLAGEQMDF